MRTALAALFLLLAAGSSLALDDAPRPGPKDPVVQGQSQKGSPVVIEPATGNGVQEEFVLPSGNIGCTYTPAGGTDVYMPADGGPELFCDRIEPQYVRIILGRSGRAVLLRDAGDQGCCVASPVLDYGSVWRAGPFTCRSQRTGLSCERGDGHSLFLSRRRISAD